MKPSLWAAFLFLSVSNAFALPAQFLAPDSTGRPQIQITATGQYYLFRAADAYDSACDSRWYVAVTDANNKTWCRTLAVYPQNSIITDTVPLDAVAENSPAEFEYKAGTSIDVNVATYLGWAPQIAVTDSDPVGIWLQKLNIQYGTDLVRSSVPDTSSPLGNINSINVTYGGAAHAWTVYYNNKYVALFNENGALMGLTHRAYGMEFINSYNRQPQNSYPYLLNIPNTSLGSSTSFTKTISNGQLILNWASLWSTGFSIKITWNLNSNSNAYNSSGLNGKIEITTSGTEIKSVMFPFVYGLSYGAGKKITVPQFNGGKIYPAPADASSSAYGTYGEYPSANWQAQFFSIQDGNYALYMAAEDPQQLPKNFHSYPVTNGAAGYNDFLHYPLDGSPNVSMSYQIVMSPIVGSWEKSAKKYQYWASKQAWNSDGTTVLPMVTSRAVSARLKQGAFWWTSFYGGGNDGRLRPSMFIDHSNTQKSLVGPNASGGNVRAAFHLYNWWDNKFDTNYPLYVPNQDLTSPPLTWQQSIGSVQNDGSLVAPYINATSTDITNASITDIPTYDGANSRDASHCPQDTTGNGWWSKLFPLGAGVDLGNAMMRGVNLLPYVSCFDSGTRLHAVMDPSNSIWQSVINSDVDTVLNLGSGGIYLDSFAAASANRASYADPATSGHAIGYGNWYRNGLQSIGANTVQNAASKEQSSPVFAEETGVRRFVASEYFSEATISYVDLIMNYEDAKPTDLPVIENIYNQFQMMVGQRSIVNSDPVRKAIFGRSFVWGYQLGPVETYLMCPGGNCSNSSSQDLLSYARSLELARENIQLSPVNLGWYSARFVGLADDTTSTNAVDFSGVNDWCYDPDDPNYRSADAAPCPASVPAVRGALWSSTGTNAADYLILTNTTGSAVTSNIPVPKAWASASLVYQSISGPDNLVTPFNNSISIYMPANSVAVYKAALATVKANQFITVTTAAPSTAVYGSTFSVAATSSSGLAVAITTSGGCTIVGSTVTMTSATNSCIVNYNQAGNSNYATASQVSSTTIATAQPGLTGVYYNTNNFTGTPAFTRVDSGINFNWGNGSPGSGVGVDNFSVRWTGRVVPPVSGSYSFCTTADDGGRLWVNGVQFPDAWWGENCTSITLTQNVPVSIRMDYVEGVLGAAVILKWSYPGQAKQVIPVSWLYAQ